MDTKPKEAPMVYIASAYSGDVETNVRKTKRYSRHVIEHGGVPFNPVLNLHGVLSEETDRERAISIDLVMLNRSDALWAYGEPSDGMKREMKEAECIGIPIRRFTEETEEIYEI